MRISDWSSDVCSSDLSGITQVAVDFLIPKYHRVSMHLILHIATCLRLPDCRRDLRCQASTVNAHNRRSEERRVVEECINTCSSRWSPTPYKNNKIRQQIRTYISIM